MLDWISHFRKWLKFLGISWKAWLRSLPVTYPPETHKQILYIHLKHTSKYCIATWNTQANAIYPETHKQVPETHKQVLDGI